MVESSSKKTNKKTSDQETQSDPVIDERLLESKDPIKSSARTKPNIKSIALGTGAVATTAGIATMAARARKQSSQKSLQPVGAFNSATKGQSIPVSGSALGKGAGVLAAGLVGATAAKKITSSKRSKKTTKSVSPTRKSSSSKSRTRHPDKQKAGYDWVADRRVKGGGYWRKKRPRAAAVIADIGRGVKKRAVAKVKRKGRSVAKGIGRSIARTLVASVAATAAGAGLKAIMERARREQPPQAPPTPSSQWAKVGKKAAIVAAEAAGATAGTAVAAELIRRSRRPRTVNIPKPPKEDTPPGASGTPKTPKSPNSPGGFNAQEPPEEDTPPGSSKVPKTPKSPVDGNAADPDPWEETASSAKASPSSGSPRTVAVSAGTAVMQKRASRTGKQMLLPQSAKAQQGANMPGVADPWEGEVESSPSSGERTTKSASSVPPSLALPSASRKLSKAQLKKAISESRDLKSKRKRTETEIDKAANKIELGKKLQQKESDADKLRGIDYEMIHSEKKANLEARLAEIQSREKQLNDILSPKPSTQINFTPLSGEGTIAPVPKGVQVIEERKQRKKAKDEKGGDASVEPAKSQEPSPVQSEETVKTKKQKRSIVQQVVNAVSRKKKEPLATQPESKKETAKERRRRERAENKQLKQELIEQTGRSASKAMIRNAYKTPLNLVVPGLGDAVEGADKFFSDKSRLEKWAKDLEESGDINVSRREFFRQGGRFVSKQTVAKPKGVTQELKRGAEISKDFFEKVVGGNTDQIILKGSKYRGLGSARGQQIQLSKNEFDRIMRTYNNQQKRQLLNFLEFIGFPIP